ncbi:YkgJ family cysteine cluster protein [Halalkalicoccus subterraneus]|uniref:YkgJ family cysteine cluster protein n=1 Tax=Halalkalicoccus subterraneus TaxID=2675002 RepID=UPI000EFD2642|nr:YkgJ family cysteine cluster protein [Halalkalicoccus subterraneus]
MEVNCAGCAGCCIDWRALSSSDIDHERRGPREPLDDAYNLVPLTRDDVRAFVEAGLGDAMTPRLWEDEEGVEIDGTTLAAVGEKPAFFVGLRKPPKPVGPFDQPPNWLPTCAFLDPTTLQCRIHGSETYPQECAEYPGHNLALEAETECERVESAFGGERLLDGEVPEGLTGLLLGPGALGQKVFVHPEPDELEGVIERLREGRATDADRAEFVAWASASAPGTTSHSDDVYERTRTRVLETASWVGESIDEWEANAGSDPEPTLVEVIEERRGAPSTPGWSDASNG